MTRPDERIDQAIDDETAAAKGRARTDEGAVGVTGPEAFAFLEALSASRLADLEPGQWRAAAFTNAQGRLVAWCRVVRTGPESALLLVPGAGAAPVLRDHLLRHRLRSRVDVVGHDNLRVRFDPRRPDRDPGALAGAAVRDPNGSWSLEPLALEAGPDASPHPHESDPHAERALRLAEIARGIPRLPGSLSGHFPLPALGPYLVATVSLTKGCFPGQEVVRKMLRLERGARRLGWGTSDVALPEGSLLVDGEGAERATVLASVDSPPHGVFVEMVLRLARDEDGVPDLREPTSGGCVRPAVVHPLPS